MSATSVDIAKDRMKALLIADRLNCTPDTFEKLQNELYRTISKYMTINADDFSVKLSQSYIYIQLTGED